MKRHFDDPDNVPVTTFARLNIDLREMLDATTRAEGWDPEETDWAFFGPWMVKSSFHDLVVSTVIEEVTPTDEAGWRSRHPQIPIDQKNGAPYVLVIRAKEYIDASGKHHPTLREH